MDFNNSLGFLSLCRHVFCQMNLLEAALYVTTFVREDEGCRVFRCLYSSKRKGNARVLLYVFKRTGVSADTCLSLKPREYLNLLETHFVCRVCELWTKLFFWEMNAARLLIVCIQVRGKVHVLARILVVCILHFTTKTLISNCHPSTAVSEYIGSPFVCTVCSLCSSESCKGCMYPRGRVSVLPRVLAEPSKCHPSTRVWSGSLPNIDRLGVERARSASGELLFKSPQLPLYRMASPSLPCYRSTDSQLVAIVGYSNFLYLRNYIHCCPSVVTCGFGNLMLLFLDTLNNPSPPPPLLWFLRNPFLSPCLLFWSYCE